jgi:hypothetical protein
MINFLLADLKETEIKGSIILKERALVIGLNLRFHISNNGINERCKLSCLFMYKVMLTSGPQQCKYKAVHTSQGVCRWGKPHNYSIVTPPCSAPYCVCE